MEIVKVGDSIYEKIELKVAIPTKYDKNSNPIEFEERWTIPELANEDTAKQCFVDTLNWLTDRYFYDVAKQRGGYLNMGEIIYDAEQGDEDAQFLKNLYDAIWAKEEELEAELEQMSLDQLLELDLKAWTKEHYDAVKAELENQSENNE